MSFFSYLAYWLGGVSLGSSSHDDGGIPGTPPPPSATQTVVPTYRFPESDLDLPDRLLSLIGSFWSESYGGSDLLQSLLFARGRLDAQSHLDLLELVASLSRFNVPIFHKENWYFLPLLESARNQTAVNLPRYDGTYRYTEAGEIFYGVPLPTSDYHCWTLPADLVEIPVILNRISDASLTWIDGVDYMVREGVLFLRRNPFDNDRIVIRDVFENNVSVDREVGLWVYRGSFDRETVFNQFGYVLGRKLPSSEAYRDFVNAIFDGIVQGTSQRATQAALSALCDVSLVREAYETVETIYRDDAALWIVTDGHAYAFHRDSTALVQTGSVVRAGDPLVDTLQIHEFNRGVVPAPAQLGALAVGRGLLAAGYYQDLVFRNVTVPLQVTTAPDGYTRVEFEVNGLPGDTIKFWDDIHAAGVAKNQTLAMLMDQRAVKTGQPTALALPATINPLEFLCQNVFRSNLTVVVTKPGRFGPHALGLQNARLLRKLVPPHTMLILVSTLEIEGDEVTMAGSGDDDAAGYEEDVTTFLGLGVAEEIEPLDYLEETVRLRQIRGRCV